MKSYPDLTNHMYAFYQFSLGSSEREVYAHYFGDKTRPKPVIIKNPFLMYLEEQNLITPSYHHSVIYINFMEMGAIHVKRSFRDIIKRNIESFYSHMHSASSLMPRNPHITNKMDDTMIYSYCAIIFYISFFHAHSTYMEKRQNGVITQNTAEYALFCQEEGFKWCDLLIRTVYNLYYGESSVSKNYSFDPIDFDDILFSELAWVMDYEWLAVSNETGQYNIGRDDALYEDPM